MSDYELSSAPTEFIEEVKQEDFEGKSKKLIMIN